jgi:DNA-binding NtrC family response regulator
MAIRLLICDPEIDRGCSGNCRQLLSFAHAALAPDTLEVRETHGCDQDEAGPDPDVVVLRIPSRQTAGIVGQLRERWSSAIIMAAVCNVPYSAPELATSLRGFDDFFCCPFLDLDFITRLCRCFPQRLAGRAVRQNALRDLRLDMVVGESEVFVRAIGRIPRLASSDATLLIGGETGTGKELFARAIHYNSDRKSHPFLPVNCAALPDLLFENEFFGHAKGAYTDAGSDVKGLLAEAEGGTIFLDEVDALSHMAQAKLLRFLQDREYRALGSSKTLTADTRVIAASNSDLRALAAQHRFREDLFHRLNILSVEVPPLRERIGDIPLLANYFLVRFAAQYKRGDLRLSYGAMRKLMAYAWPGNVRELEGLLHRAVVFGDNDVIDTDEIELPVACKIPAESASTSKDHVMEEAERSYLRDLLLEHHGNLSHAAKAAGKDRRTIQRLLRKHSIERVRYQTA